MAVELLIVEGVVLYGSDDALGLDTPNERRHESAVEIRIFRKVLEVAAANGRAGDVDAGTEEEVDAAGACVLAQALANFAG